MRTKKQIKATMYVRKMQALLQLLVREPVHDIQLLKYVSVVCCMLCDAFFLLRIGVLVFRFAVSMAQEFVAYFNLNEVMKRALMVPFSSILWSELAYEKLILIHADLMIWLIFTITKCSLHIPSPLQSSSQRISL